MTIVSRPSGLELWILDGGTGSELRRRGVGLSSRCWSAEANLSHTDVVTGIHADYIRAGADIITANTFATSRFVLAAAGLDDRFEAINQAAIDAAHRAASGAGREVTVAASMSCLPPAFDVGAYPSAESEYAAYVELAACFADNGIDLILLEMMQQPGHAARACRAARASGLPFWIGISCRVDRRTGRLVAFDDPDQPIAVVIDAILPFEPQGIAIMHSPIDAVAAAVTALGQRWSGSIGAYAEIGCCDETDGGANQAVGPEAYADAAGEWLDRGAALIGGCCGTTPSHIEALTRLRDS